MIVKRETIEETNQEVEVSNHDIAKLKEILESDGEAQPSDLSKIALNSSLKTKELVVSEESESPDEGVAAPPRELSVEEALAEMYQLSDLEGKEDEEEPIANGQDVLLINLAEIFDSSSDLYVVQCDMNENILGVVANEEPEIEGEPNLVQVSPEEEEQVDTLQLIQLLAEPQPEFDATPLIHHEEIIHGETPDPHKDRRKLLKYLHGKYVQSRISRFYHAHQILRKYKRQRAGRKRPWRVK